MSFRNPSEGCVRSNGIDCQIQSDGMMLRNKSIVFSVNDVDLKIQSWSPVGDVLRGIEVLQGIKRFPTFFCHQIGQTGERRIKMQLSDVGQLGFLA